MMNWMSQIWFGLHPRDLKKLYKYDLANSLVTLIALSLDHQNHSKWPKWGYVRYMYAIGGDSSIGPM